MANQPSEPKVVRKTALRLRLTTALEEAPAKIHFEQINYDALNRAYAERAAQLTIEAFSAEIFPAKDGSKRAAANDTERSAAIQYMLVNDVELYEIRGRLDTAKANLDRAKHNFEAAHKVASLLVSDDRRKTPRRM